MYETVTGRESCMCRTVMPSEPAELVFFKCLIVRITVFISTGWGLKKFLIYGTLWISMSLTCGTTIVLCCLKGAFSHTHEYFNNISAISE